MTADVTAGESAGGTAIGRQRVDARGEITVDVGGLRHLHQSGSAKIRLPRCSSDVFEAILMNTAGGLTGDDHMHWQASCAADARLALSTAASEKLYRTHGPSAHQDTALSVGRDGLLAWLPQETIVFDGSSLIRRMEVDLEPGARLLACESFVYGRAAMGEKLGKISLRDDWRIRRDGQLLHAEAFRFRGDWSKTAPHLGIAHGLGASATVLYCAQMNKEALSADRIIGIETGGCPHTAIREDASINLRAIETLLSQVPDLDLILIESGGDNLAATFSPELADLSIYVISVCQGDDIPRKGGPAITRSDLLIINKRDLAPHVGADLSTMMADARATRKHRPTLLSDLRSGEGVEDICRFIKETGGLGDQSINAAVAPAPPRR